MKFRREVGKRQASVCFAGKQWQQLLSKKTIGRQQGSFSQRHPMNCLVTTPLPHHYRPGFVKAGGVGDAIDVGSCRNAGNVDI
jgi:hypothetical protein